MDITSMSPHTGRLVMEDGSIWNMADALAELTNADPVSKAKIPITAMSPRTGRMVREDGSIINIANLLKEWIDSGGSGGDGGTTNYNDLSNKPILNGVEISGDKTSADYKISAQVTQVDHGTADTTFTLPPNQYHTWGEVASLTITLGAGTSGQANGYWFSFDSGDTATTLSLPETVKTDIVVEPNMHYECSIVGNYMTFEEWEVSA